MEYGLVVLGVVVSLLQSVLNHYFQFTEGEKVTATLVLNFVATLITLAVLWTIGLPLTVDSTIVVGGVTIGANQLWHIIVKYSPRLKDFLTNTPKH